MKVLITGIAGFIGSHVAEKLLERGHAVFGFDNLSGGTLDNVPKNCVFYDGDIRDSDFVDRFVRDVSPDAVIHCAAPAAEVFSHHARAFYYAQNLVGTANIVNACVNHGVKVLSYTSSIAVYGEPFTPPPFSEDDTAPVPKDPYGVAKFACEQELRVAQEFFGLNYVAFRCHNVIGTRQNGGDALRNVAAIFIRQALEGKQLTVYGDGSQRRAFSPVGYVADVIASSIERDETWNQTYNLGSDSDFSVEWLARAIIDIHGSGEIAHLPARHEAHQAFCDHSKVHAAFPDIAPPPCIFDALRSMYDEAKSRPPRAMQQRPEVECSKNMPEVWQR